MRSGEVKAACKFVPKPGRATRFPALWRRDFKVAQSPTHPLGSSVQAPFFKVCQEGNIFFLFIKKNLFSFAVSFILT